MGDFEQFDPNITLLSSKVDPWTPLPDWFQLLFTVGFIIIWVPAIVLNLMVCWIILAEKTMRMRVSNYPLLNLAIADLLSSIFNTPFSFYYMLHNHWSLGKIWCTINSFLSWFFITVSVFTLTGISIDRYLVLVKEKAKKSMLVMCLTGLSIWVAGALINLPTLYYFSGFDIKNDSRSICSWNRTTDYNVQLEKKFNLFFTVISYVLPLVCMAYCYWHVCKKLWYSELIGERNNTQQRMREDRKRMVRMLITVVALFAFCWLPTQVYLTVELFWNDLSQSIYAQYVYLFCYWLAMSNNMMNPLVYFIVLPNFRKGLNQILSRFKTMFIRCCCFCQGSVKNIAGRPGSGQNERSTKFFSSQKNDLSTSGIFA